MPLNPQGLNSIMEGFASDFKNTIAETLANSIEKIPATAAQFNFETGVTDTVSVVNSDGEAQNDIIYTHNDNVIDGESLGNYYDQNQGRAVAEAVCAALGPMLKDMSAAIINYILNNLTVTIDTTKLAATLQFVMPAIPASPAPLIPLSPLPPLTNLTGGIS